MTPIDSPKTQTEAVGVFHDAETFQAAIDELLSRGFGWSDLSLVASVSAVEDTLGHAYTKVEELEDDPDVPTTAYVSNETIGDAEGAVIGGLVYVGAVTAAGAVVASGGTLAAAITGAAMIGGAGGLFGAVIAAMIGDHHATYLQDQLDRGGLLLWVRTRDKAHEDRATEILSKHSAHDVHVHALARRSD